MSTPARYLKRATVDVMPDATWVAAIRHCPWGFAVHHDRCSVSPERPCDCVPLTVSTGGVLARA